MRITARLAAVVATALLSTLAITSCDEGSDSQVGGSPAAPQSSGAGSPSNEYPKVQTPLDPSSYLKDPCRLVPPNVLNSIAEVGEGEPDVDSTAAEKLTGPRCTWISKDASGADVTLAIDTVRRDKADDGFKGIAAEYRSKESGDIDHLQPLAIPGHPGNPAVIAGQASKINNGSCPVTVGLTDDLTFTVIVIDREDPQGACEGAQKVAAAVLDTLSGGK